ncbi:MAG: acetoacetate--CoA ligase [Actinobacteria bacterium]|nr:acetoacetate--CoA ligase [Actinomycetota bacterium]
MGEILWSPEPADVEATALWRFMRSLPHPFDDYHDLWEWSVTERGDFWQAMWDFAGVIASRPADAAVGREGMPGTEWFPGARLNYAENLLRRDDDSPAIIAAAEGRPTATITWRDLRRRVAGAREGLLAAGVEAGDRVAALIPNCPEAIVGMLAAASIGAIWSSCSPDFGAMGVVDRFGQIAPKVLITADGYRYHGKVIPLGATISSVLDAIPSPDLVVVVDFIGEEPGLDRDWMPWEEFEAGDAGRLEFAQLPFDHPLYIMYSSGTTGPPKSIVHAAGGVLLKHLCEQKVISEVRPGDRVFWFTTCGWMMWNWLTGNLASEATVVLYDGSPAQPDLGALWRLAGEHRVTHFGTSPKFLLTCANQGVEPAQIADLAALRWVGSTGAPLNPEQFDWVYGHVSGDVNVSSITGGTDLLGVFAGGVSILPVRRGEITARWLGMAVDAFDEQGESLVGAQGELVCTAPWPTLPVGFWGDPDGSRYRAAYFEMFPGVWAHGDYAEITPHGGVIVTGRSDTTLNPGGVRIGTAEIYRAIERLPEVEDAIVVGRDVGDDQEVVLFVVPAAGVGLDEALEARIRAAIRSNATPRHVPKQIVAVSAVPYTISGKKVEKAVHKVLAGETVRNRDALANPESLEEYEAARATL